MSTIEVSAEEASALVAFIDLAYGCFGPGADDVIYEFGEDRYESMWALASRAMEATR